MFGGFIELVCAEFVRQRLEIIAIDLLIGSIGLGARVCKAAPTERGQVRICDGNGLGRRKKFLVGAR